MADKAHELTDELLVEMEERLSEIYREARAGIEGKTAEYFKQFEKLDAQKKRLVARGELTHDEYLQWRQNKIMYGKRWARLKEQLAAELANVNRTALAYINGRIPEVYALNYNASGEGIAEQVRGYSFELVDAHTVKNLAVSDKTLLPYKYLDVVKDVRWNTKKVNAAVLQGILQGESIPKMAKRLQRVTEMNRASAIRNARTSVTSAECKGRQDSYEKAAQDGIELKREWISTNDNRTRHSHVLLDGQLADVDKPFKSELGPIMYPGDPEADPANVYNCRCTVAAKVIGFERKDDKKHLTSDTTGGIIQSESMHRKSTNTGVFEQYPERMSKKHIRRVAKECGINIEGITIKIEKNEDLVSLDITGLAVPEHIGTIIFMPNAFISREELIRTIYHEKIHVEQFKEYGAIFVQNNRKAFEDEAYEKESQFIEHLKERGII